MGSRPQGSLSVLAGGYSSKVHMMVPSGKLLPMFHLWSFLSFVRPCTFDGRKTQVGAGLVGDPGSVGEMAASAFLPQPVPFKT